MSKTTKRKHVVKEVLEDYILPSEERQVAKIVEVRGNNLHSVEVASGECFLVSMPTKFRKNVWVKRGDFVLVQPIAEGNRVKGEICTILYKDQIKYIKASNLWPTAFDTDKPASAADGAGPPSAAAPAVAAAETAVLAAAAADHGDEAADGAVTSESDDELPDEWGANPNRRPPMNTLPSSDLSESECTDDDQ